MSFDGAPICVSETGNSRTDSGSMPWLSNSVGSCGPTAASGRSPADAAIAAKNVVRAALTAAPAGVELNQ